ncbi:MAG: DUF2220 family protein [Treponema sp.]|jgi:hypothetical protein|nr:DUF2220 family protein [Treponema sp.]
MTTWESRIVNAFTARYPASSLAALPGGGEESSRESPPLEIPPETPPKTPRPLRLRPEQIFPGLERASADNQESFLEAAESLEKQGLLSLVWARHRKGEILNTLICSSPDLLYDFSGRVSPRVSAETVRAAARSFAAGGTIAGDFFSFIAQSFSTLDASGGIDAAALTELARLAAALREADGSRIPLTTRALSVALYRDSKRLEYLLDLFGPLLSRARRQGIAVPDFSFLDRSYPETFIAGKIAFEFAEEPAEQQPPCPLVNAPGGILGLPLETILKLRRIRPLTGPLTERRPAVLTVENKETFFALSQSLPGYTCFLYAAGHPNRAVRALVSLLAESGFSFHHAGDLDPDGILILQELEKIAGTDMRPLRMDAETFNRYLGCGKKLKPSALKRTSLIGEKTRSIPGIAELIGRIEETGMGVEQEILDYTGSPLIRR